MDLIYVAVGVASVVSGLVLVPLARRARERQAQAASRAQSCVACGSDALVYAGPTRTCRACGYSGAANGGGGLSEAQLAAVSLPDDLYRGH